MSPVYWDWINAKAQTKSKNRGLLELEFFSNLATFFQLLGSPNSDDTDKAVNDLTAVMYKRASHKHLREKKLKEQLVQVIGIIHSHKKSNQIANTAKIAKAIYMGVDEGQTSRESFKDLAMHLTDLSQQIDTDDEVDRLPQVRESKSDRKSLLADVHKMKMRKKYYITSDVWMKHETIGVDFYVPNLDQTCATKLSADAARNSISVEFEIPTKRQGKDVKFIQRDTFHGRLVKYIKLPAKVDFSQGSKTLVRPNCLTLTFVRSATD